MVVHNLEEAHGESQADRVKGDSEKFKQLVKEGLKLAVGTTKAFRVGRGDPGRPRLLIVTLASLADKLEILRSAAALRDSKWGNVYITPYLTWKERETASE